MTLIPWTIKFANGRIVFTHQPSRPAAMLAARAIAINTGTVVSSVVKFQV